MTDRQADGQTDRRRQMDKGEVRQQTDSLSANKKQRPGGLYLEPFLCSMQASNFHGSLDHSLQMELRGAEHHLVGLNAAEVQDISDKSQ